MVLREPIESDGAHSCHVASCTLYGTVTVRHLSHEHTVHRTFHYSLSGHTKHDTKSPPRPAVSLLCEYNKIGRRARRRRQPSCSPSFEAATADTITSCVRGVHS